MALEKQMELFDDGGLLDEGGTVDEESGNDVPVGSLKKEVRDDIPAQLSEGEFVMPADVVRYHGLDKMMALRDEAKMGLQRMEAMGQMGNADEATIPDGVPFALIDLEIVDENDEPLEMQVGGYVPNIPQQQPYGVVQQPAGQNIYSVPSQFQPQQPVIQPIPFTPTQQPGGYMPVFEQQPTQPTGTDFTFEQFMPTVGGTSETREYRNADGNSLYIPFINGEPIYPIPEGYTPYTPETDTPAPEDTSVPTTAPRQYREDDPSETSPPIAGATAGFGGIKYDLAYESSEQTAPGFLGSLLAKRDRVVLTDARGRTANMSRETYEGLTEDRNSPETKAMLDRLFEASALANADIEQSPDYKKGLFSDNRKELDEKGARGILNQLGIEYTGQTYAEAIILNQDAQGGVSTTAVTTAPEQVTVETTLQTTADAGTAVGELAQKKASELNAAMNQLKLSEAQKMDYLVNLADIGSGTVTFRAGPDDLLGTSVDFSKFSGDARAAAKEIISVIESGGSEDLQKLLSTSRGKLPGTADDVFPAAASSAAVTTTADPTSDLLAGEPGAEIGSASYRQQRDIENKISAAKTANPSQYAKDVRAGVYDSEFDALDKARAEVRLEQNSQTNKVGVNIKDTYGEEIARKVRDDQGTFKRVDNDGGIYYDSSHNWAEPTQTNVNTGSSSKAEETAESRDDKIVCTEMYRQTQLDDWKHAIKIWGVYEKKYLTPYHQTGYHYLFKPWVRGMQTSTILTSVGAYLAKARTQHLKHIMTKGKSKDSLVGNVWCKIIHPIVYITGRMLSWQKK